MFAPYRHVKRRITVDAIISRYNDGYNYSHSLGRSARAQANTNDQIAGPSTSRLRIATAAVASLTAPADALLAQTPTAHARRRLLVAPMYPPVDAAAALLPAPIPTADARLPQEIDTRHQEAIATGLVLALRCL